MMGMERVYVEVPGGRVLVSEAGVFAIAQEARQAEALGREVYARLGLPVVPLVVSPREGYREGVLHVADLEGHLQGLPRVLTPEEVQAIARFLRGEGERPRARLRYPAEPGGEGGSVAKAGQAGQVLATKEAIPEPRVAKTAPPRPSPFLFLAFPPILYAAYAGGLVGLPGLVFALWFLMEQDRLLREGGDEEGYAIHFSFVFQGLALSALLGAFGPGALHGLGSGLAFALLPALYGVLAAYRPLFAGEAARLYALVWGDAFPWLVPLGLVLTFPAFADGVLEALKAPLPMALVGLAVLVLFGRSLDRK